MGIYYPDFSEPRRDLENMKTVIVMHLRDQDG